MTEAEGRAAVEAEAASWDGTRYHPEAEVKVQRDADGTIIDPGGVDCGKLLSCVFINAGLIQPFEIEHYPADWHMHRGEERYLNLMLPRAREITEAEAQPADVVLYKWGRVYSHGAIIMQPGWPNIMHAYSEAKRVMRDLGDIGRHGYNRPRRFFSYWPAR